MFNSLNDNPSCMIFLRKVFVTFSLEVCFASTNLKLQNVHSLFQRMNEKKVLSEFKFQGKLFLYITLHLNM